MSSAFQGLNEEFYKYVEEEIKMIEETILQGNINEIAEYKRLVGKRTGLYSALNRHKELISYMDQD